MFGLGTYNPADTPYPCLRHWFVCPEQARYFGDEGSLLGFFDWTEEKREQLSAEGQPPFGLGASVWGTDKKRTYDLASRMEAGTVWINKHLDIAAHIPFGGAKQSGLGGELAEEGLHEFTQLQIINAAV